MAISFFQEMLACATENTFFNVYNQNMRKEDFFVLLKGVRIESQVCSTKKKKFKISISVKKNGQIKLKAKMRARATGCKFFFPVQPKKSSNKSCLCRF